MNEPEARTDFRIDRNDVDQIDVYLDRLQRKIWEQVDKAHRIILEFCKAWGVRYDTEHQCFYAATVPIHWNLKLLPCAFRQDYEYVLEILRMEVSEDIRIADRLPDIFPEELRHLPLYPESEIIIGVCPRTSRPVLWKAGAPPILGTKDYLHERVQFGLRFASYDGLRRDYRAMLCMPPRDLCHMLNDLTVYPVEGAGNCVPQHLIDEIYRERTSPTSG